MYEFKAPEICDKQWVDKLLKRPDNFNCELCFGNLFIWSSVYNNLIVNFKNYFIAKNISETANIYSFPIGEGTPEELAEALQFVLADAKGEGKGCTFYGISEKQKQQLELLMPDLFAYSSNSAHFDYIYTMESLRTLSGKKLHSKRNHIANFKRMYADWQFESIGLSNITECLDMHFKWVAENDDETQSDAYQNELKAVRLAFNHFKELDFVGGLIRVNGEVAAYTFGEAINNAVFCTHVEKAFSTMRGAYPMINQTFTQQCLHGFDLVNREEDLGLEGLRKAKQSYRPQLWLEKISAVYGG